jgi:signal transduction histidine kinase
LHITETQMMIKLLLIGTAVSVQSVMGLMMFNHEDIDQDNSGQYYIYNEKTESFSAIPQSTEGVDSLLALSQEVSDKDSKLAFISAREALLLSEAIGYTDGMARALIMVANKYLDFGDYEHALQHYLSAMELENELGNKERVAILLNNIALVHLEQENYARGAEYLTLSIELTREIGDGDQIYLMLNNLGVIHRRQGNYDEALKRFRESQQQALDLAADTLVHMVATLNIGNTLRNKGELDEALGYMLKANNYFEKQDLTLHQITSFLFLGQLYMDRNETANALKYAGQSLDLSLRENQRERIKDAHQLLATIYESEGDSSRAFTHYKLYHQYSDTLYNIQRSNLIQEMQMRFDVEQKNRELDLLNNEFALQEARIIQQRQVRNSLIGGIALLLVIAILLVYMNRQKKQNYELLKKRREEIEEQNRMLAELNKEKDEFLSIVAHDMRNPLSVIKTAVELIETDENPDHENLEEYSGLIQISTDRMMNLVNNLLDVQSMKEHSSRTVKSDKLDVDELLEQSMQHFKRSASVKNISLIRRSDGYAGTIIGDHDSFVRIMDNLISNAIKYAPFNSEVKICTAVYDNNLRITVIDEGPGIHTEDQHKLFGKFSKLSNKPTGNENSTGLGLYIVKKLVQSMGGSVGVRSQPGKGSEFYVEFNIVQNESDRKKATENMMNSGNPD